MRNKILIIDDDQDYLEATATLLEANGYDVIKATGGQEGFYKVKDESPDMIILDMMMAYRTEGADVAQALAADAASQHIPVVMVTEVRRGMNFPLEMRPDSPQLPVKRILEKPVKPEVLLGVIKSYISQTGKEHRQVIAGLDALAEKWRGKKGNLVMILHEIQNHYGYVPRGVAFELSRILDMPLARIYEVITFYNYFKLDPPGKNLVSVCMGTACYLKGTPQILAELKNLLHIDEGQTSKDGLFHLQVVRCLGCCGLAPVMMVNNKVYGKVKPEQVVEIISAYTHDQAAEKVVS